MKLKVGDYAIVRKEIAYPDFHSPLGVNGSMALLAGRKVRITWVGMDSYHINLDSWSYDDRMLKKCDSNVIKTANIRINPLQSFHKYLIIDCPQLLLWIKKIRPDTLKSGHNFSLSQSELNKLLKTCECVLAVHNKAQVLLPYDHSFVRDNKFYGDDYFETVKEIRDMLLNVVSERETSPVTWTATW